MIRATRRETEAVAVGCDGHEAVTVEVAVSLTESPVAGGLASLVLQAEGSEAAANGIAASADFSLAIGLLWCVVVARFASAAGCFVSGVFGGHGSVVHV